ncbi:gluconokinase [Phycicoccus duodecadis]|uniref:Gluconokinase n=1 Tax=Phycicoccus duodecadis TaxID=173053 RepID=A0A2N3YLE2_9MICO|nr:gluconokinase, GntK/IdnK-type [Phycicoccus duodecadis]PKW27691.1 gluconate kinase (SKI family) [Phycicoccus duodecadis]
MTPGAGDPMPPRHVVVMGVSGSGKSTVARGLADALGLTFGEADDFHPAENIARMAAGTPLTDADRRPWLLALAAWTADRDREGRSTVMACSALRRRYRDLLRAGPPVLFVHLDGPADVVQARLAARTGHFMPPALLASQLALLEPLAPDEAGVVLDLRHDLDSLVHEAAAWLMTQPATERPAGLDGGS